MTYEVVYIMCTIVSIIVEIYLVFDFYKAFHFIRNIFSKRLSQMLLGGAIVLVNVFINLQNNDLYNFIGVTSLYLFICMILIEGNIWSRILHWLLLVFVMVSSEMIFPFLFQVLIEGSANKIFHNGFVTASGVLTIKLLQFILLTVVKQMSKMSIKKLSEKVFATFIMIPIVTFGIMFMIPCVREAKEIISKWEIILLLFYLLLLIGNIYLFFIFWGYSNILEERKLCCNKAEILDEQYKEYIHNIKYYLKQISIYLEGKQYKKIADILSELQTGIHSEEKDIICSNQFLNALLIDYREVAKRNNVQTDIFVEAGFKIEFMREGDTTSILGNLLDNAMEAAKECKSGKISVDLYMENGGSLAVCRIENNFVGELKSEGIQLLTTKKNPELHGIGLKSVNRLVDQYSGYLQQDYEKGVYVTTVILPVQM